MIAIKKQITNLFLLLIAITATSCGGLITPKIDEGEIIYKISYPGSEDNMMISVMPDKMYFKFKDGKTISELPAGMGLFNMAIKTDSASKKLVQEVKVLSEKKGITYNYAELQKMFDYEPKLKIEPTKETKEVAGYKCTKAHVTFPDGEREPFDIFYTKQLNIPNANWYNQFKEIDGVILEYNVKRWGFETHFEAIKVEKKLVDSVIFNPDKSFRTVGQREIDQIFENFN